MEDNKQKSAVRSEHIVKYLEEKCSHFLHDIPKDILPHSIKGEIKNVFDEAENYEKNSLRD